MASQSHDWLAVTPVDCGDEYPTVPLSTWVVELSAKFTRIRDLINTKLSAADFLEESVECRHAVGDSVFLFVSGAAPKVQVTT